MKEKIKNLLVGLALGTANIIPGVSGGTIAMTMGIYERLIGIASNIFKDLKKNIMFLLPIGIGMVLAILLLSKVINYSLENYEFQTVFFFVGLILGGLPFLFKKVTKKSIGVKNVMISVICFALVFSLTFLNEGNNVVNLDAVTFPLLIKLFIVGIIAAATMVIPGISGSFILMLLGYYKPIVETISNLTNFDLLIHNGLVLGSFGVGIIVGIVLISKIIEFLLKKRPTETYFGIYGIIISSIVVIIMGISSVPSVGGIIIGFVLMSIGALAASKLN